MMNKLNLLAGAALLCAASASAQTKPFSIKGFVNGYEDKYLYLGYSSQDTYVVDSCLVKDGTFSFKGTIGEGAFGTFTTNKDGLRYYMDGQTYVMMSPADMVVAINVFDPRHPVVIGSKAQYEEDEYSSVVADENAILNAVNKLSHASKDEAYKESLEKFSEPFQQASDKKSMAYIKSHPDTDKSLIVLAFLMGRCSLDEAKELYGCLSDRLKQQDRAKEIASEIATREKIEPGKPAPDFTATDINGKKFTFSKLKGKYVVLDFWASWCGPCRASNPHMKELYEKYGKKGLDFVYVSDDDSNPQKWRDAVKKDGLEPFHHVLRGLKIADAKTYKLDKTNDISDKYAVHYLPTKYLIDKDGNMVGKFDTDELTAKLKEIFGF